MTKPVGCSCEEFKWNSESGSCWVEWCASLELWRLVDFPKSKAIFFCPWCGSKLNTSYKAPHAVL